MKKFLLFLFLVVFIHLPVCANSLNKEFFNKGLLTTMMGLGTYIAANCVYKSYNEIKKPNKSVSNKIVYGLMAGCSGYATVCLGTFFLEELSKLSKTPITQ